MDIEGIRRAKLEELIQEFGSATLLARRLEVSRHRIYQLKNRHVLFSDKTARAIEKKLGKPHSWMDGFSFSLEGVDRNLEQMLQVIIPMLQREQIGSQKFYEPAVMANIVIVALKAMYIQVSSQKAQGRDEETVLESLRSVAVALTPRLFPADEN